MIKKKSNLIFHYCFLLFVLLGLALLWMVIGIQYFSLNADLARDLTELSNLLLGDMVWLGPQLRAGFPASPVYFYLFLPGLLFTQSSAYSLIATQVMIAGSFVALFWYFLKKNALTSFITVSFIALSSWFTTSVIHPWNGTLYVLFILTSLVLFWYTKKTFLSIVVFGSAVAIHPAALLVLPLILYEVLSTKTLNLWKKSIFLVVGMGLAWLPIIVFEVITKGYLLRQWLTHMQAKSDFALQLNFENLHNLLQLAGLPLFLLLTLLILSIALSTTRAKIWYASLIPAVVFISLLGTLHTYYLLGVLSVIFFLLAVSLHHTKIGIFLLGVSALVYARALITTYQPSFSEAQRPTNRLESVSQTIDRLIDNKTITQAQTYALVSVIDAQNSTPQADEYRFVLRSKGFSALNIPQYSSADVLLVFFETDIDNPQDWSDWHTQQFGSHTSIETILVEDVVVVVRKRK